MKNYYKYKTNNKIIKKSFLLIITIILYLIFILINNTDNNSNNFQPYYTPKLSMYGNPTITPNVPSYITLNPNMTPFINAHEDCVAPNGLDPTSPWYYGSVIRESIKPNWTRVGLWGQVYLQAGYKSIPENVGLL